MTSLPDKKDLHAIGYFSKLHGYKGELTAALDTGDIHDYEDLEILFLEKQGTLVPYFVESLEYKTNTAAKVSTTTLAKPTDMPDVVMPSAEPAPMRTLASTLARRGTTPCSNHSCSCGPKRGCDNNHARMRGEPRAQHPAASKSKGVVGSSGTNTPTAPAAKHSQPAPVQSRLRMGLLRP